MVKFSFIKAKMVKFSSKKAKLVKFTEINPARRNW